MRTKVVAMRTQHKARDIQKRWVVHVDGKRYPVYEVIKFPLHQSGPLVTLKVSDHAAPFGVGYLGPFGYEDLLEVGD
jgi:hypothetical protein